MLKSDEPVTYEGQFFHLRGATLLPRPQRPGGPRILIGGNGVKRTLPLVVCYADIWKGTFLSPNEFRERSAQLDNLLNEAGRRPGDVKRTLMRAVYFGRDTAEVDRRLNWLSTDPDYAGKSLDEVLHILFTQKHEIVGTPDMILEQIQAYAAAGVEELMLQWFDLDDIDGLRAFAKSVLLHL